MGKECIELISRKLSRDMTPEEFYSATLTLDRKYPSSGHWPPLSKDQMADYKDIIDEKTRNPIVPYNFKEAAEMYIRHRERVMAENPAPESWKSRKVFKLRPGDQ